jgi:ankyrin repeat protein
VQTLLGAGAAVNDAWDGGATALLLAAQSGHLEVCVVLILAGADVVRADSDGLTPLLAAAMGGHEAVAVEIMRHAVARRQQAIAAN